MSVYKAGLKQQWLGMEGDLGRKGTLVFCFWDRASLAFEVCSRAAPRDPSVSAGIKGVCTTTTQQEYGWIFYFVLDRKVCAQKIAIFKYSALIIFSKIWSVTNRWMCYMQFCCFKDSWELFVCMSIVCMCVCSCVYMCMCVCSCVHCFCRQEEVISY